MGFKRYEESHTEWTIFFLKLCETILCFMCLIYHIKAILYVEEPMPHNVVFCSTFGGFFILSLAGVFVPISGQLSPPGVDLVFCLTAFVLLLTSAIFAMYYVTIDPHLKQEDFTDEMEGNHQFFINCHTHVGGLCVTSVVAGTFFLMHACFSADRLNTVRKGLDEEAAEVAGRPAAAYADIPIVDIAPDTPITLYLFMLDYCVYLYNTRCFRRIRKVCGCKLPTEEERRRRSSKKRKRLSPHQKAALKAKRDQIRNSMRVASTVDTKENKDKDEPPAKKR